MARKFKYKYGVNTGVFTVTRNPGTFTRGATTSTGTFTLTGNDSDLHKNVVPTVAVDTGIFLVTGNNATLNVTPAFNVDTGTFSVSGTDATFNVNRTPFIDAASKTFSVTGNDATLEASVFIDTFSLEAETGDFEVDAAPVTFVLNTFFDECHPAFQLGAFQFNAFQMCQEDTGGGEESQGHGGKQIKPEDLEVLKKQQNRYAQGLEQLIRHNAAVNLGRRGGLKGGPARAAAMTSAQLSKSASLAAKSRWK